MQRSAKVLFELARRVDQANDAQAMTTLRGHFADLMDQAAAELSRRGMDQDDCELVRLASMRGPNSDVEVEFAVRGLASATALLLDAPLPKPVACEADAVGVLSSVVQVAVRVVQELGVPFGPAAGDPFR